MIGSSTALSGISAGASALYKSSGLNLLSGAGGLAGSNFGILDQLLHKKNPYDDGKNFYDHSAQREGTLLKNLQEMKSGSLALSQSLKGLTKGESLQVPVRSEDSDGNDFDEEKAAGQVREMVSAFNDMLSLAEKNRNSWGASRLSYDLTSAYSAYRPALEKIGIGMNDEGRLTVDENKIAEAAGNGHLERFSSENKSVASGFTNRLSQIANQVNRNPTAYVASKVSDSSGIMSLFSNRSLFPFAQQYAYAGLLFDSLA